MLRWRDRDAEKQVRARRVNEWTRDPGADPCRSSIGLLRCECRDPECRDLLAPTPAEYGAVRMHATRFIVAPNHENPESERIVEENSRFAVVEAVTWAGVNQARSSYPPWQRQT